MDSGFSVTNERPRNVDQPHAAAVRSGWMSGYRAVSRSRSLPCDHACSRPDTTPALNSLALAFPPFFPLSTRRIITPCRNVAEIRCAFPRCAREFSSRRTNERRVNDVSFLPSSRSRRVSDWFAVSLRATTDRVRQMRDRQWDVAGVVFSTRDGIRSF